MEHKDPYLLKEEKQNPGTCRSTWQDSTVNHKEIVSMCLSISMAATKGQYGFVKNTRLILSHFHNQEHPY